MVVTAHSLHKASCFMRFDLVVFSVGLRIHFMESVIEYLMSVFKSNTQFWYNSIVFIVSIICGQICKSG